MALFDDNDLTGIDNSDDSLDKILPEQNKTDTIQQEIVTPPIN
jgi:hypothetical protein